MRILIVGGKGTIGKHLVEYFSESHEVVVAGRNSGELSMDMANSSSIEQALEKAGNFDAIVVAAGEAKWALLKDLSEEDFYVGIRSKLMGQVNMVRIGLNYLNPGGSITLSTGILADDPVLMTTSAAMVNGAIHSFMLAANLELNQDRRINVVCAGLVEDSKEKYRDYFPGHSAVPMNKVVNAYSKSVEGAISGQIIRVNS